MMKVLVSEYTAFVTLAQVGLADAMFRIPGVGFAAVDLLLAREFTAEQQAWLGQVGLEVVTLTDLELMAASDYQRSAKCISLTDAGALIAAKGRGLAVFADHGHLRYCAEADGLSLVDALWAMDRLELYGILKGAQLRASLEAMLARPRCRLPPDEVAERMSRWLATESQPTCPSLRTPMNKARGKA